MAKKSTPVEEPQIDYSEINETPIEAIVSELQEQPEEKIVEEPKEEEKKEEAPKLVTEVVDEEVPFDPEAYKKEVLAEAAKLIEQSTGKKEDKKEIDEELVSPWTKEGRTPKDYEEVADWAMTKKSILDARQVEQETKQLEEQKRINEAKNKEQIDNFNKFTDEALEDLYTSGKLDRNNPEERKALFQSMMDVNIERQKAGKPPVWSIKEIYYEHYKKPEPKQPAGADAPISGGMSAPTQESQEINYIKDVQPGRNMTQWFNNVFSKKS